MAGSVSELASLAPRSKRSLAATDESVCCLMRNEGCECCCGCAATMASLRVLDGVLCMLRWLLLRCLMRSVGAVVMAAVARCDARRESGATVGVPFSAA
jgi:hypothetical protein